jgi:putrescine transport system permease protein
MVIFSKVRLGVSPEVNALATIIISIVALAVFVGGWRAFSVDKKRNVVGAQTE